MFYYCYSCDNQQMGITFQLLNKQFLMVALRWYNDFFEQSLLFNPSLVRQHYSMVPPERSTTLADETV